jgi:hypothetical protein
MEKMFPLERVVTKFKGPLFESENYALSKPKPGMEEPLWVTSRR